jgi:hypothetical protein
MEKLQDSFNAEISADAKTELLELEPDEEQPGHCAASFIPDVETTYKFRVWEFKRKSVSIEFLSSPGAVPEDTVAGNSTEKISDPRKKKK